MVRIVRTPKNYSTIFRIAKEDPWSFIHANFYKLAVYYAKRYSAILKNRVLVEDIRNDILYEMVECYKHHSQVRYRPIGEVIKILKLVPINFYRNRIARKENTVPRIDIQLMKNCLVISDVHSFMSAYDKFFERFLTDHYNLDHDSDEYQIISEIFSQSADFREYLNERGRNTVTLFILKSFFRKYKRWSGERFDAAIHDVAQIIWREAP